MKEQKEESSVLAATSTYFVRESGEEVYLQNCPISQKMEPDLKEIAQEKTRPKFY